MIRAIRHGVFRLDVDVVLNTDERDAVIAKRSRVVFAACVCVVALTHRKPWMLIFAPAEWLMRYTTADDRFSDFCATCTAMCWLVYTLGQTPLGPIPYVFLALEAAYTDNNLTTFFGVFVTVSSVLCVMWYLIPWLPLVPVWPLLEKRWSGVALRIPILVVAAA